MNTKRIATLALTMVFAAVGLLPAFALANSDKNNGDNGRELGRKNKNQVVELTQADLVCAQTAVEKRDNAILAGFTTYSDSVKIALTARRDALKAAWGLVDKIARKEAVRKAWNDYSAVVKTARKTFNLARKDAWKQFKADKKTCNVHIEDGEKGMDSSL